MFKDSDEDRCPCGRDVRYNTIYDYNGKERNVLDGGFPFFGSCNKRRRCPTRDDLMLIISSLENEVESLKSENKDFRLALRVMKGV